MQRNIYYNGSIYIKFKNRQKPILSVYFWGKRKQWLEVGAAEMVVVTELVVVKQVYLLYESLAAQL